MIIDKRNLFADRSSFQGSRMSSLLGGTSSEIIAIQAAFDAAVLQEEDDDSSLGAARPLANYKEATPALVGGKAFQCWRLMKHGLAVPPAFCISTYAYSLHIAQAGIVDLIDEVFASDLRDESAREATKPKLAQIREKILSTPLNQGVVKNLKTFLDALGPDDTVAVRSSGSAEDLASQSFAGQYDTFLYKRTLEEVCGSVKACYASMFKGHILDYTTKAAAVVDVGDNEDPNEPSVWSKPPSMGVLIMKMVDAKAAGVCFSQNLWGDKTKEVMVEAVLGQGEGLVGGEITPDRYIISKLNGKLIYQDLHPQTHKFVRSSNMAGVEKIGIDPFFEDAVLNTKDLRAISKVACAIEKYYNSPQDIEWAIDEDGSLFVLQSRPITTTDYAGSLSFLPPGEGLWKFDPTHHPLPLTPWFQKHYSLDYAFYHGRRVGCLIKDIKLRFVHGFAFNQPILSPPTEALERSALAYWKKQLYEDDYREFQDFFRVECEELQDELRSVDPGSLSHRSLIEYVARCFDLTVEFWLRHHTYTFPCLVVVGDYMNRMSELTGNDVMETLTLLDGSSPESRGLLNHADPLLAKLYDLLRKDKIALELLQHKDSAWALDCLLHMTNELGNVMKQVCLKYGWRLVGGYDLVVPSMIETPGFFLKTLFIGCEEDPKAAEKAREQVRAKADKWKSQLPKEKHDEFEDILRVGQRFFRLRDERALASDISGVGLCRRGILAGGRCLAEAGAISKPEHLLVATKHEAISLLQGDLTLLGGEGRNAGAANAPSPQELERRYDYVTAADPNMVPHTLGTPPPPSDLANLPPGIRRTMAAIDTSLFRGLFGENQVEKDEEVIADKDMVKGLAAATGVVEGKVCLILQDGDLQKAKKDDIIVTRSSSSSFNAILAVAKGIVTDYGGMLSHAAIVAREIGIPAVVGSQHATTKFNDGDIVRIDSSSGKVTVVKRKN